MINWARVNELRDEVGAEDFNEVVELFLEEVEEVMVRLRKNPDPGSYETDLHFLKGSALNLGFDAMADICGKGEIDARGPAVADIDLGPVFETYDQSKAEFQTGQQQKYCAA